MARPLLQRLGVAEGLARRFLILCLGLGFAALIAAVAAAAWTTARTQEHSYWVSHTYQVELAVTQVANVIEQSETVRRGYLLTGQKVYLTVIATWRRNWNLVWRKPNSYRQITPASAAMPPGCAR